MCFDLLLSLSLRDYCTISFVITRAKVKTLNKHVAEKPHKKARNSAHFSTTEREKKSVHYATGYINPPGAAMSFSATSTQFLNASSDSALTSLGSPFRSLITNIQSKSLVHLEAIPFLPITVT